ncbi:MAG TPA: hypothetical protein VIH57_21180, partial [Bacteroidales bacterium]
MKEIFNILSHKPGMKAKHVDIPVLCYVKKRLILSIVLATISAISIFGQTTLTAGTATYNGTWSGGTWSAGAPTSGAAF